MRPGWYHDPEDAGRYRWWSGTGWTPALSDSDDAPMPPPGLPEVPPGRQLPWGLLLAGAVVVAVIAALTVIGVTHGPASRGQVVATPPIGTPSTVPRISAVSATIDAATGRVSVLDDRLTMPVPGAPWKQSGSYCSELKGLFASACLFGDLSFTETGSDTVVPPVLAAGALLPAWVGGASVEEATERLLTTWNSRSHSDVSATYTLTGVTSVTAAGGRETYEATATATFDLAGRHHSRAFIARVTEVYPGALAAAILLTDDLMSASSREAATAAFEGIVSG
jgi:hypothetical protein